MLLIGLGPRPADADAHHRQPELGRPADMGVATSASTFFRQIGGTLGTAVLLSLLFTVFPTNIQNSLTRQGHADHRAGCRAHPVRGQRAGEQADHGHRSTTRSSTPIEKSAQPARTQPASERSRQGVPQDVVGAAGTGRADRLLEATSAAVVDKAVPKIRRARRGGRRTARSTTRRS